MSLTHQYVFDYHEGDIYWCTADVGWVILFIQGGQNDLLTVDPIVWLSSYSDYLAGFRAAIASSRKLVKMGISTHNPRNDAQFKALSRASTTLTAIPEDKLYVFTHPDMHAEVNERFTATVAAMDKAAR